MVFPIDPKNVVRMRQELQKESARKLQSNDFYLQVPKKLIDPVCRHAGIIKESLDSYTLFGYKVVWQGDSVQLICKD